MSTFRSLLTAFLAECRLASVSSQAWHDFALHVIESCLSEPEQIVNSALFALQKNKSKVSLEHMRQASQRASAKISTNRSAPELLRRQFVDVFDLDSIPSSTAKRLKDPDDFSTSPRPSKRVHQMEKGNMDNNNIQPDKPRSLFAFQLLKTTGVSCDGDAYIDLQDVIVAGAELGVICNFQIDMPWMWNRAPALQTFRQLVIVHGSSVEEEQQWQQFLENEGISDSRVRLVRPSLPSYGTMHSKMFLLFYETGCRICIHTANMVEGDWDFKTQAAYLRDFPTHRQAPGDLESGPKLTSAQSSRHVSCDFREDLGEYMSRCLKGQERQVVLTALDKYDFSSAGVAIVSSVPGVHRGQDRHRFGHARLRNLLEANVIAESAQDSVAVCQFSSLGSIQEKWLTEELATTLFAQGNIPDEISRAAPRGEIKLVFPTVQQVEESNEGLQAGASIPVRSSNMCRNHITSRLCKWDATFSGRQYAMPHIKTFLRYPTSSPDTPTWLFVGSFNLSVAAWGRMQGAKGKRPWDRLNILSYEIGVLFIPRLFCRPVFTLPDATVKYTPRPEKYWADTCGRAPPIRLKLYKFNQGQAVSDSNAEETALLPLPYRIPPTQYTDTDTPWTIERCSMM